MALLDAILEPNWDCRYYAFNKEWGAGQQLGSMRDGSGDDFHALFTATGCWLKGFAHESPMTPYDLTPTRVWPSVLDAVPAEFADCLREPAFVVEDTTFCVWRRYADTAWQCGPVTFPDGESDPDGSGYLLSLLDGRPETYAAWAAEYYSRPDLSVEWVRHVYEHRPLTEELVRRLNPERTLDKLRADIAGIAYPPSGES